MRANDALVPEIDCSRNLTFVLDLESRQKIRNTVNQSRTDANMGGFTTG